MGFNKPRYFRCSKCGEAIRKVPNPTKTDIANMPLCTKPMQVRTSGICGGSFTIEMTEDEYNETLKDWEINKKQ